MCGRYALYATEEEIVSHFRLAGGFSMRSRFNIAPTQIIPVVSRFFSPITFLRWGFVPAWGTSTDAGYMNARIESITEKPAFKRAFATHRCLIPVSGYYEWVTRGKRKQPYFVTLPHHPLMGLAGVWSEQSSSCAILTQSASDNLSMLHERSPIVIPVQHYGQWLSTTPLTMLEATTLFMDLNHEEIAIRAVTTQMNRVNFEGSECILPL